MNLYKWCVVPQCKSTTAKTPNKIFIRVPKDIVMREKWLQAARRDPSVLTNVSIIFFCEDHFDLPKDVANYRQYTQRLTSRIVLMPGVLPSKFHCQQSTGKEYYEITNKNEIQQLEDQSTQAVPVIVINEDNVITDLPIMNFFNNLINNTAASLTLTNAQIVDILEKEFEINIKKMHNLGVDIYISIIKEYLKEWPGWEDFDQLKTDGKILQKKYESMKWFLRNILDNAKPHIEKAVKDEQSREIANTVVMEVRCSRDQLNHLIHRDPRSDTSTDIFNITDRIQNRIILHEWDLESILKLQAQIFITLPCLVYARTMDHITKHVLINRVHTKHAYKNEQQDTSLMAKINKVKLTKSHIVTLLDKLLDYYKDNPAYSLYEIVLNLIRNELLLISSSDVISSHISKILNKYPYYRYLHSDRVVDSEKKYDLQIEETIIPRLQIKIDRYGVFVEQNLPLKDWLILKCVYCGHEFGCSNTNEVVEHYNVYHQNERDWFCTNCNTRFNMKELVESTWCHQC